MRVLITINHPAHVYVFRDLIFQLKSKNHEVSVLASDKEGSLLLLNKFGIDHIVLGEHKSSIFSKIVNYPKKWLKIFSFCYQYKPDYALGIADFYIAQISIFLSYKSIILTDTEHVKHDPFLTFPFADYVLTPDCFDKEIRPSQIKYNSYHELAYLHSNFKPDPSVLDDLGVSKEEKYVILRIIAWKAFHDIGIEGISENIIKRIIEVLRPNYRIFISSEEEIASDLEDYRIAIPIEKMHSALFYSSLYLGEGATMASEAAILGTPSIYINQLNVGYLNDLERNYQIVFIPKNEKEIFQQISKIENDHSDERRSIREEILEAKLNLTDYLMNFLDKITFQENINKRP